ncbi:MAG: Exodeoxyribonuclease VII large subunit [Candidatus Saccharicenans subterraneus]|uniref:Exodeoxyribonuclease 7 large subunit n=1 Tax=Candidatus Saccharicenans subterraneus TaxID=2508984 RepID=A0A3E2BQM4_9BACT|nr:MAG: Exodeoxyribonuclease VII large subunit [Candidatus Saccharicenans subterraneum]
MKTESLIVRDRVYTVSELTRLVRLELESAFPFVWVEGEISNLRQPASGHFYFTLKDENAQLRAVMFRSDASRIQSELKKNNLSPRFELKDGMKVICGGRVTVYEKSGDYQLVVEKLEPRGKGALQLAFEQLKARLQAEGLFDPKYKKKLPLLPKKIGIVTSPTGAAIRDILRIIERRFNRLHIIIYPSLVQGEGAAQNIAQGLDYFSRRDDIDVVIVGRGGGSIEDLWAFNEEVVARAIFNCMKTKPVISAVGHEIDFTIADFVADIRASTPSAAAEMVVSKEEEFREKIDNLLNRLCQLEKYQLERLRSRVNLLAEERIIRNFKYRLMSLDQRVDELENRAWKSIQTRKQLLSDYKNRSQQLRQTMTHLLQIRLSELNGLWKRLASSLDNLSPLNVIKKGYTICWKAGGLLPVQKASEVEPGEEVIVSFYRGELNCRVNRVDPKVKIESKFIKESQ